MRILGIESSCDETAAAVIVGGRTVASNVVASQVLDHAPWGGVLPELASRRHLENIGPVVERALAEAGSTLDDLDGIAVTRGPGLVGSLLVGLCYAKAIAAARGLPIVGVNHIEAHVAALGLEHHDIEYPAVALVVSGGHTALYLQGSPGELVLLGRTRDDAVGEAFDKVGKLLGLPYPGGPSIDRIARELGPGRRLHAFPRARLRDGSLDFSFSGLKSAVARHVREGGVTPALPGSDAPEPVKEVAAAFQEAAIATLLGNLRRAVTERRPRAILLAGGVACNSALRRLVQELGSELGVRVHLPSPSLSTDNGAMVGALGSRLLAEGVRHGSELDADPALVTGSGAGRSPTGMLTAR